MRDLFIFNIECLSGVNRDRADERGFEHIEDERTIVDILRERGFVYDASPLMTIRRSEKSDCFVKISGNDNSSYFSLLENKIGMSSVDGIRLSRYSSIFLNFDYGISCILEDENLAGNGSFHGLGKISLIIDKCFDGKYDSFFDENPNYNISRIGLV